MNSIYIRIFMCFPALIAFWIVACSNKETADSPRTSAKHTTSEVSSIQSDSSVSKNTVEESSTSTSSLCPVDSEYSSHLTNLLQSELAGFFFSAFIEGHEMLTVTCAKDESFSKVSSILDIAYADLKNNILHPDVKAFCEAPNGGTFAIQQGLNPKTGWVAMTSKFGAMVDLLWDKMQDECEGNIPKCIMSDDEYFNVFRRPSNTVIPRSAWPFDNLSDLSGYSSHSTNESSSDTRSFDYTDVKDLHMDGPSVFIGKTCKMRISWTGNHSGNASGGGRIRVYFCRSGQIYYNFDFLLNYKPNLREAVRNLESGECGPIAVFKITESDLGELISLSEY